MKKKSILSQFTNIYNNLEEYLLIISLVCNVLLVFLQVIMRTVFKNSLTWSEELSRYIFIWQIWLGASTALKYNEHIRVTLIYSFMKSEKLKAVIGLAADFIWFLFCAYMVLNGKELLVSMAARNAASSGLQLPQRRDRQAPGKLFRFPDRPCYGRTGNGYNYRMHVFCGDFRFRSCYRIGRGGIYDS